MLSNADPAYHRVSYACGDSRTNFLEARWGFLPLLSAYLYERGGISGVELSARPRLVRFQATEPGDSLQAVPHPTVIFPHTALMSYRRLMASRRILQSAGVTCRRLGLLSIALLVFLGGVLKPALAETEVCGSSCSAWATETNAGPAAQENFGVPDDLAWKELSTNYIHFANGLPGEWSNPRGIPEFLISLNRPTSGQLTTI
jgi:hypothetical protein